MECYLYHTTDPENKVNKQLEQIALRNIHLKRDESQESPHIKLRTFEEVPQVNYIYIPNFKRYYFVTEIENLNNQIFDFYCETDVLMTYKEPILNGTATITKTKNPTYFNGGTNEDSRTETDKYYSDVTIPDKESKILVTLGG
ncbi:MAG: hypothetical protein L0L04_02945 [Staphylococcus equorum]|nr:hypothetical protein [Tetragenococcus sp.]MDN6698466.1 hypothetical protein [Staphylococcus equorum]